MTDPGTLLLAVALVGGAAGVPAALLTLRDPRYRRVSDGLYATHAAAAGGSLLLLVTYFLTGALHVRYVWAHTHLDYPWYYRLSGMWAGQEGTVILWLAFTSLFFGVEKARKRRAGGEGRLHLVAQALILLFTTALAGHLIAIDAFGATEPNLLRFSTTSAGRGLSEVLITPFMVIHPPVQFMAYALLAIPAAFALAGVVAREEDWSGPAYWWARPGWAAGTLGLGLGGLWAYYVLSFGGYWAWDPVETANLLPWLALTGFMHAGKYRQRFGDFRFTSVLLAFLAWWLTVFATFATRSGLWVSVHAFTDPTGRFNPDAAARFLSILEVHATSRFFFAVLAAGLFLALALFARSGFGDLPKGARRVARAVAGASGFAAGFAALAPLATVSALVEGGNVLAFGRTAAGFGLLVGVLLGVPLLYLYVAGSEDEGPQKKVDWMSPRPLMYAAVTLFGVALAVTALLNFQVVNGMNRALFDLRAPFVVIPLVLVLTVALSRGPLGRKGALALAGAGVVGAAAGVAWRPGLWPITSTLPVLAAATAASVVKIAHVNRSGGAPRQLQAAGVLLLISSLLGLVMWSNPPSHLGGRPFPGGWGVGVIAFALGVLSLLGAVALFRQRAFPLVVAGAIAGTVSAGYGVGALFGLGALVLAIGNRGAFRGGVGALFKSEGPRLRETGTYVIHFAVLVGLLGVALTIPTYQPELKEGFVVWPVGETREVGAYAFTLTGFSGEPGESGYPGYDRMIGHLAITKNDRAYGSGKLEFYWKDPPIGHYDPALDIQRGLLGDLYINPLAFCVRDPCADSTNWIQAHGDATRFQSEDVKAATVEITYLPLMTLVWAGLWLMVGGMLLVMLGQSRIGKKA